ncbi:MAG TPA: ATP-binding protein, partial [Albitalea sp.]
DPGAAPRNPIAVRDLINTILRDATSLRPVDHDLRVEVAEGVLLLGDYNEIYSAFSNLVFNAVQYTPPGGVISIGWRCAEHGASFEVADTGVGIEAEHLPRLTERFYRVDSSRSRDTGGTGLGLSIVKHVVQRHGGELEIRSEPGKGSSFKLVFPAARIRVGAAATIVADA